MIEVELLPARYGDAIWIRYGQSAASLHHVLIDTGFEATANGLRQRLRAAGDVELDLFVLTHIDADHIEGSVFLLQDLEVATPARIHEVWFNGWEQIDAVADDALGALQGEYFSALIRKRKLLWNKRFKGKAVVVPDAGRLPEATLAGGMKLTLLSPSVEKLKALRSYWVKDLKGKLEPGDEKAALRLLAEDAKYAPDALGAHAKIETLVARRFAEDTAKANGSSIAFLAEYGGKRMLFTGDAHPGVLVAALDRLEGPSDPLKVDLFKLAHHGSRRNTSPALVERVRCKHALVSTNGDKFEHPDDECIARLIDRHRGEGLTLHFNYPSSFNARWKESAQMRSYGYRTQYGDAGSLTVRL